MFDKIYPHHKKMIYLVFAIVFITCLCILLCLAEFDRIKDFVGFTKLFISNIVTFISISFAFYLTNLTILFSSKYIKDFRQEDNIKPNQRKIHTLKTYFTLAIYCALLTIIASFAVLFIAVFGGKYLLIFAFSILMAIFIENFIFIFLLLKIFMNALIIQTRGNP